MGCRSFLASLAVALVWPAGALADGLFAEVEILPDATSRAAATEFGITTIEAERRGALEPAVGRLYLTLSEDMPAVLGGLWLDNRQERWVKITVAGAATDSEYRAVVDLVTDAGLAAETDLSRQGPSMKELLALMDEVSRLGGKEIVSVGLEPQGPRIVVGHSGETAPSALVGFGVDHPGLFRYQSEQPSKPLACSALQCGPPLRGGIRVTRSGSQCTSGFVVRRSTTDIDLLTAGHCTLRDTVPDWSARTTTGALVVVGGAHSIVANGCATTPCSVGDAGLIHIRPSSNWDPRGFVYVEESTNTLRDPSYSINATAVPVVGTFLCLTGAGVAGSYTDCGTVTVYPTTVTSTNGRYYGGLARSSDLIAHSGDSGGSVYKIGNAYGVVSHAGAAGATLMPAQAAASATGSTVVLCGGTTTCYP